MVSLETLDMAANSAWFISEACSTDLVLIITEPLLEGNFLFHENQYNIVRGINSSPSRAKPDFGLYRLGKSNHRIASMERQFCVRCGAEITEENCIRIRDCSDQTRRHYSSAGAKEDDSVTDCVGHVYCICGGIAVFEDELGCRFCNADIRRGKYPCSLLGLKQCRYLYPKLQCDCPHFKPAIRLTDK